MGLIKEKVSFLMPHTINCILCVHFIYLIISEQQWQPIVMSHSTKDQTGTITNRVKAKTRRWASTISPKQKDAVLLQTANKRASGFIIHLWAPICAVNKSWASVCSSVFSYFQIDPNMCEWWGLMHTHILRMACVQFWAIKKINTREENKRFKIFKHGLNFLTLFTVFLKRFFLTQHKENNKWFAW